jgi:hypothetical protein
LQTHRHPKRHGLGPELGGSQHARASLLSAHCLHPLDQPSAEACRRYGFSTHRLSISMSLGLSGDLEKMTVPVMTWACSSRHLHQSLKLLDNLSKPSAVGSKGDPSSLSRTCSKIHLPSPSSAGSYNTRASLTCLASLPELPDSISTLRRMFSAATRMYVFTNFIRNRKKQNNMYQYDPCEETLSWNVLKRLSISPPPNCVRTCWLGFSR